MSCRVLVAGPGVFAIACGRGERRTRCGTPGCSGWTVKLCDWPVTRKGKAVTCDAKLCGRCAQPWTDGKDLCPPHKRLSVRPAGAVYVPAVGDARVHVDWGMTLYVAEIRTVGGADFVVVARGPADGAGRYPGPLQTVSADRWVAKTRAT